jgi:hypothetical protein
VPLDGEPVARIVARLLARAEAIGGERGRDYLEERLKVVKDRWSVAKTGSARLGYSGGSFKQQQLVGLLEQAVGKRWTDLTVGISMRETENEVNLLVPAAGELFNPLYGAPDWSFGADTANTANGADLPDDEDLPDGDELGESTLTGRSS